MRIGLHILFVLGWLLLPAGVGGLCAATASAEFDAANNLYFTNKFAEAAEAYGKLIAGGQRSATLYFNLGNACYKAEQMGRAIAAYRQAERLTPRDAALRANLQFVRKKVNGDERGIGPFWRDWLATLTLNEWAMTGAVLVWGWFLVLALREFKPGWRRALHSCTLWLGLTMLVSLACLAAAAYDRLANRFAVVVMKEAVLRFGPLQESRVSHQLQDGSEVSVVDEKDNWLQVRDRKGRFGWLKRDQVQLF
jgi:tetratricopeptide (TPR) repeat protein